MTFEEWYPYKDRLTEHGKYTAYETMIHHKEYEAAAAAWHAGQEAMRDRVLKAASEEYCDAQREGLDADAAHDCAMNAIRNLVL